MSTITDKLKQGREAFLIVKAEIGGRHYWWSTKPLTIPVTSADDIMVDGLILNQPSFQLSLDIRTMRASIPIISIELANRDSFQDIETIVEIDSSFANVYLWCDGLTWTDIETDGLMFRGLIQKKQHDKFRYSFDIVDMRKQYSRLVPENTINPTTWPYHRIIDGGGTVAGKTQPLVYGEFDKGIPCLQVDTGTVGYYWLICNHGVLSTEAEYNAGTEIFYNALTGTVHPVADYTKTEGYDYLGNVVSYFIGTINISDPTACSVRGVKDDGAGTYTGTAAALVERAGSILYHLLDNHTNLDKDYIDIASLKTIDSIIPGVRLAVYVNDQVDTFDVIDRIGTQIGAFTSIAPGSKIGVTIVDFDMEISGHIDCEKDIIGFPVFSKTPLEAVVNSITVNYGYNASTQAFEKWLAYDRTNNEDCRLSYFDYGASKTKVLNLYDAQSIVAASILATRYLRLYARHRNIIEFSCPIYTAWDYLLGTVAGITSIDGPGNWSARRCMLIEKNVQGNIMRTKWMDIAG